MPKRVVIGNAICVWSVLTELGRGRLGSERSGDGDTGRPVGAVIKYIKIVPPFYILQFIYSMIAVLLHCVEHDYIVLHFFYNLHKWFIRAINIFFHPCAKYYSARISFRLLK